MTRGPTSPNRLLPAALAAAAILAASPAAATSGFGCYRANVGPSDALNVRAAPTARSAVVGTIDWTSGAIVALVAPGLRGEGRQPSLFDVHQAELSSCVPSGLPLGARWCPVALFDGDASTNGWIKRRFVDHSECP